MNTTSYLATDFLGEADFVQRRRQASLCRTREEQNRELCPSKTAPHLGTGWMLGTRKTSAVLTLISTTNYCKDYFEGRVHSSFVSLCALLQTAWSNLWRWAFGGEDVGTPYHSYTELLIMQVPCKYLKL